MNRAAPTPGRRSRSARSTPTRTGSGPTRPTPGEVRIWDINAVGSDISGDGWASLGTWTRYVVAALTGEIKRASGGWHITHAIEVSR
jgi:hypothetical protein